MSNRKFEIDMCNGSIFKNVVMFAIPLIFSSLLQLLYNAADLVVVSRFAGSDAMASVGATATITNLIINISIGFALGGSVIVARRYGAKDYDGVHKAVHSAILLGIITGLVSCAAGILLSEPLLVLMGTPEGRVLDGAVLYMRIIFLGVPASVVYNFSASILRAVGDTKRPLYILACTGLVNVALNLILVIGFHMEVAGVAIGTIAANYLSAIFALLILIRSDGSYKLILSKLRFYKQEVKDIIKVGLPAGVQGSFFSLSNTIIQSTVNTFGEAAIAGNAAGGNIEGFVYTAMNAFYQATLTCVSQNYGARNEKRINKSIYVPALCVVAVGFTMGLLTVIFSKQLLGIYITDSAEALGFGVKRMLVTGLPYFLCGIMEVLTGALRGLGYSSVTAVSSFIGACGFRIFWAYAIVPLHRTVETLYSCWPISWFLVIIMHLITLAIVKPRAIKRMHMQET